MQPKVYVAYYRVSTVRQGLSALGLQAQQAAVAAFAKPPCSIEAQFIEIESGKKNTRPQLLAAIAFARAHKAVLLIAKLDRLSRSVEFIFRLRDSGINFVCADMPEANTFTIGILAVMAQHERELISARTKAALHAKRQREVWQPGTPANLTEEARLKGASVRKKNAAEHQANVQAGKLIALYRGQGLSFRAVASELNNSGYRTRRGKLFNPGTVKVLSDRNMNKVFSLSDQTGKVHS